jgi:hypothetical protein
MLHIRKGRWIGNAWASIDISPNDETYFLRILAYLAHRYGFPIPHVSDLIDGYVADFQLLATDACIHIDSCTCSIAFADDAIRDRVLVDL